jgi:adhesin transport system membrane fusion protein
MKIDKVKFTKIEPNTINTNPHYKDVDLEYMSSLSSAVLEKTTLKSRYLVWIIVISICWLILWAANAKIDERTRGLGKVIPTQKVQIVQNLEGGIVSEIYVREGDDVKKNAPLLKLKDVMFSSSYEENKLKIDSLQAKAMRLHAQAYDVSFDISQMTGDENYMSILKAEKSLYDSNIRQLNSTLEIVSSQLIQKKSELIEATAKIKNLKKTLELVKEEMKIKKPLVDKGIISNVDFIQLKRDENDIESDLEAVTLSIPRIESTIKEVEQKYNETKLSFQSKSKQELNDVNTELKSIQETIGALSDRVKRTLVLSPVDGTVKQLFANTIGGVIQPGMDIVEIVPHDGGLLIEVKIEPKDVAFLKEGQEATIKFTAYDFSIYGGLVGYVNRISADTITDKQDNTFYLVDIKTDKNYLTFKGKKLDIKVGMVANADILTGKKTILDYLLKPILKAKDTALRER